MRQVHPLLHTSFVIILFMSLLGVVKSQILFHQELLASTQVLGILITPSPLPSPTPTPIPLPPLPVITAPSYQIKPLNQPSLLTQDINTPRPPASATKIMTSIIALETYTPDQIITTPPIKTIGSQIGLVEGEQLTFQNLLYGLLLASGNDVALTLAHQSPQGSDGFTTSMNNKAQALQLHQTHFVNAAGLDDPQQYMSVNDLTILTEHALENPLFTKIVATKSIDITDQQKIFVHNLVNRNELLFEDLGVTGVKTGTTEAAGQVLVTSLERLGQTYLIVVMGSLDRYADTRALISWIDQYLGLAPIPTITPTLEPTITPSPTPIPEPTFTPSPTLTPETTTPTPTSFPQ